MVQRTGKGDVQIIIIILHLEIKKGGEGVGGGGGGGRLGFCMKSVRKKEGGG